LWESALVLCDRINRFVRPTRGTLAKMSLNHVLRCRSLYNHPYTPNARYRDAGRRAEDCVALRDIETGEEITIHDHGDPEDRGPADFEVL